MFTGIIKSQAVLVGRKNLKKQTQLTFKVLGKNSHFQLGESVAVDGACLTVAAFRGINFSADLIPETLRATTLGNLKVGQRVNLERSLRVGDFLGGHWVTGHVDGVGFIRKIERRDQNFRLQIEARPDIIHHLVLKGSVAVDGISFTLQEVRKRSCEIGVTPRTFRETTLQWKRVGDPVNLEVDILSKLVRRLLSGTQRLSFKEKDLRRQGF